jgi:ubiquitin C-terminal hydrolase
MPDPLPQTREEFERVIQHGAEVFEGRNCGVCKRKGSAHKIYQLRRASEVIVCLFPTAYKDRCELYIPHYFTLPGTKGPLVYRKVAEAEHFGGRDEGHYQTSGHYQARGLRAGEQVCILNDSSVFSSFFTSKKESRNVYLAFYHHCATRPLAGREENGEAAVSSLQDFIVPAERSVAPKDVFDFSELYEGLD